MWTGSKNTDSIQIKTRGIGKVVVIFFNYMLSLTKKNFKITPSVRPSRQGTVFPTRN